MKKEINEIKKILQPLNEYIQKEKERKKKKEEEKNNILNKVKNWIAPGKTVTFNLIFKKTRDGDTADIFHGFCENKGKTLIIIETTKGRKFGGFTNENWDQSGQWKYRNSNDFVFSIDLNKVYKHKGGTNSTIGAKNYGPVFGDSRPSQCDILFQDNTLNVGYTTNGSYNSNKELNYGEEKYETKEMEVYQVFIN